MEHQQQGYQRKQIKGTDPQFLIEKIIRERIYDSVFWKHSLFAANAEILVDKGADLIAIGGQYGNQRPTEFLACLLKLLQIQPETEIIDLYLQDEFKYLTALAAFYIRMTGTSVEVYKKLEPLLLDRRKLRKRGADGCYYLTYMDEFVDELLNSDRVCDTILPRLTKRYVLEDNGEIDPRVSPLEEELEAFQEDEQVPEESEPEETLKEITIDEIDPLHKQKKKYSKKKVKGLFKKVVKKKEVEEEVEEPKPQKSNDISLTFHETNILRANLGLPPLQ